VSTARRDFDWPGHLGSALDPVTATRMYKEACKDSLALGGRDADYCTMCGEHWCSLRINKELRQAIKP
jgi:phosphomethylpyrimidine synthase